jgi:hypothetical protein
MRDGKPPSLIFVLELISVSRRFGFEPWDSEGTANRLER